MNRIIQIFCELVTVKLALNMILYVFLSSILASVNAISGGHDTKITPYQWALSLQYNNEHFCGATLISPTWALTSASCAKLYPDGLTLRAGSTSKSSGGQVLEIANIVVHPNYSPITHDSDLALIQFTEEADSDITFSISHPIAGREPTRIDSLVMVGWGRTANGTLPDNLQMVVTTIVDREQCQTAYPSTVITLNMFCGGYLPSGLTGSSASACDGDYGGAGAIGNKLVGIMSWGKGCGESKYPTVLTFVTNFLPWIKEISGGFK